MAFSNWTFFGNAPTVVAYNDLIDPVAGNASLSVVFQSGTDLRSNGFENVYLKGMVKGRIRTLVTPRSLSGAGSFQAGFVFMQSQTDVSNGAGSCYGVWYTADAGGINTRFTVRKYLSGLVDNAGGTVLYDGPFLGTVSEGNISAIEVEWDGSSATAVDISVRRAINSTDFNSMVVETVVTDNTAPLISSVAEGVGFLNPSGAGPSEWSMDSTRITRLL